ncbi:hypothetical protein D5086_033631 [Populus alba]|uniref:Uncharacterized protein n=1 Tax=Populus alba TaxID=43335 RepID=A0ACC4AHA6_POPAL
MATSCKVAVDSVNVSKNRYLDVVPCSEKPSDHVTDILKDAGAVSCMWRASVVENKGSGYWNCTLLAAGILSTSHFFETVIGQSPQRRSYENKHPPPEHIITKFRICLDGGKSFLSPVLWWKRINMLSPSPDCFSSRQRNRLCVFCIFSIPKGLIMEFPRTQMVSGKFSEEHTIRHPVLALLWIHPNYLCCRLSSTLFTGNNTSSAMKLPLMNS